MSRRISRKIHASTKATEVASFHRADRLLTRFGNTVKVVAAIAALLAVGHTNAHADSFADPAATTAWNASRWNNTTDALAV